MTPTSPPTITQLLVAWNQGDPGALEQLTPLVYRELHRLAHGYLAGERHGHVLQTTALVNEAFVRLIEWQKVEWQSRAHFFAVASNIMRQILVDYARAQHRVRRGGNAQQVPLDEALVVSNGRAAELLQLDDALNSLAKFDARKSRIAELRYFGGLSVEETALVLNVSAVTVMREWRVTKAWLLQEMSKGDGMMKKRSGGKL
ncbi:MAG: sigma-70 family RNA polymerase sigma factor [Blastocatellia bacterium]|nr:sigma-70 family RNA polymerase sigma factor [Blastocatellia bacterium]